MALQFSSQRPRFNSTTHAFDPQEIGKILDIMYQDSDRLIYEYIKAKLTERPRTFNHGDLRSDNIFKSKTDPTDLHVIDWQLINAGPGGTDLVQAIFFSCDVTDTDQIDELVSTYYAALEAASGELASVYTKEMAKEDWQLYTIQFICGYTAIIGGYMDGLKDDPENDLWELTRHALPRIGSIITNLQVLNKLEEIAAGVGK